MINFYIKGEAQSTTEGLQEDDADRLESTWGKLHQAKLEFTQAREGDHLLVPFECDLCIFQKLRNQREPNYELRKDKLLMACIRRINLDCFWSRASSTVIGNRDKARLALKLSESVGLKGPFEHTTSLPTFDHCGYEVAIEMILDSTAPGRYSRDHKQWDTIRKLRTVYSSQAKASPQANISTLAFSDDRGKAQRLVMDKCSSYWFSRFFVGCKRRMGQDWRPNKAFSIHLILEIIIAVELKISDALTLESKHNWIVFGTYFVVTYVLSLRGVEGLLLDIEGLLQYRSKGDNSYFIITLLGKIKGEHHHRCHLLPCSNITSSGIPVKEWVHRLLDHMTERGFEKGPAIADLSGNVQSCGHLDDQLTEILEGLYEDQQHLFPASIQSKEDIISGYSVFRSLRRSSDTQAIENNVSHNDIALVNRWSIVERAQGNRAAFPMYQHYAQVELLVEPFKRYTWAM